MQLFGWSLLQLLGAFAFASALTLALYLLKLRRRVVPVPFIALWESLLADRQSSRLFARLRHLISLCLALLVVALLTLARSDPRPRGTPGAAAQRLLIVDAGLTMQAHDLPGGRLAAAREHARGLLRTAQAGQRTMVAQLDQSVTPLSSMSEELPALEQALDHITESDLSSDPQNAYRFALDVLAGKPGSELVLISDQQSLPEPELAAALKRARIGVQNIAIGRRGDNVAITAFALRRYPLDRNRGELLLALHNSSPHTEHAELTLIGDGAPIDVQRFELAAGQTLQRTYDDVTGVQRTLQAQLHVEGDHDDLAADDRAYAVVPERKRLRVLCVTEGNRYLEAALLLDEYLDVDLISPAAYRNAAGHDVVIFDRVVPQLPADAPAIYLAPNGSGPGQPLKVEGTFEHPAFERVQSKHPLMRFLALRDVNVASALLVHPEAGDTVIAADPRGPLILAGTRAKQPFVALTFDALQSDLPLRVAWPLLLLHAIDGFSEQDQSYAAPSSVGEPVAIALPEGITHARVQAPGAEERELAVSAGGVVLTPTRAGFYRVHWDGGERWLAANLSPDARNDLTLPARSSIVPARVASVEATAPLSQPIWVWLVLAALLLLSAEWLSYHRRWTV